MTKVKRLLEEGYRLTQDMHRCGSDLVEKSDARTEVIRTLHDTHDMTFAAIAEELGVTAQAIQKAYNRKDER